MPVEVERIEKGIYRYRWLGRVKTEETIDALKKAVEMARSSGDNPHVQILDMTEVERIPLDVRGLGKIGEMQKKDVLRVIVVKAPAAARVFGETLARVLPALRSLEFHNTLHEAVRSAQSVVRDYYGQEEK